MRRSKLHFKDHGAEEAWCGLRRTRWTRRPYRGSRVCSRCNLVMHERYLAALREVAILQDVMTGNTGWTGANTR